jgi:hypothetical protein
MLAHLRARITHKLSETEFVMLATSGPAGVQIGQCRARSVGLLIYLMLPTASEHLVNLEHIPEAAVTADLWQLTGIARLDEKQHPFSERETRWHSVVEIRPRRFEFLGEMGGQVAETIDVEESDLREK